jgi:fructose/tagatose bisphosphate aldolase
VIQVHADRDVRVDLDEAVDQVPAFNINNMEQGLAIMAAADATDSPVILQASRGARAMSKSSETVDVAGL